MHELRLQVIHALEKTISPNPNELKAAEKFLKDAAESNLQEFLKTLSEVIKYGGNSPISREAACLLLKNQIFSKDPIINDGLKQQWMNFTNEYRTYIKKNVLGTLGTEIKSPSSAAQCVAYIAAIELPQNQWPELLDYLVNNVINDSSTELQKESSLDAIGYICEEISPEVLALKSNSILTAIVHGMRAEETSNSIRLAAAKALFNSLEFTKANFEKDNERHYIMQVVCEGTQCEDPIIAVVALQCLVKIVSLYYPFMELYMRQALFTITVSAMKSNNNDIALQGIEFWSSISEEEIDLAIEESEAREDGHGPINASRHYARGALSYITPILLARLVQQEENDEDDWNPCKAASSCLMLLASCCGNEILSHVMPFVTQNVKNEDWKYRDASLMVLGAVIGGLDQVTLKPLAEQSLPILIAAMHDSNHFVKDSAAWGIGRVCEIIPSVAISEQYLKVTLECLVNGLKGSARVATNACWAFTGLAEAAYAEAKEKEGTDRPSTTCLSQYFEFIIPRLLEATERQDASQSNLRTVAYEAIMEMVKNSAVDCYVTVQKVTTIIIDQLQRIILLDNQNAAGNHSENFKEINHLSDLKSLLCGTLQSVLNKVTAEDAPKISDAVMTAMLELLNQATHVSVNTGLQEDALMAISSLINLLGENFTKYMDSFMPYLFAALNNYQEYQVCKAAVGLCGDIFRELRSGFIPYSNDMMKVLLGILANGQVDRSVKPVILSAFGDLAMNSSPCLQNYFSIIMRVFTEAALVQPPSSSYEDITYINDLHEAILEAYSSVLHGLNSEDKSNNQLRLLEPYLPQIAQLIQVISEVQQYANTNVYGVAGLVYDLCTIFGAKMLPVLDNDHVTKFLTKNLKQSRNNRTKEMIHRSLRAITNLRMNPEQDKQRS